jgi:hypothetical protein
MFVGGKAVLSAGWYSQGSEMSLSDNKKTGALGPGCSSRMKSWCVTAADTVYEAYGRFGGEGTDPGNNTMTLGAGNWLFRLKLDTTAEMTGAGVKGTIDVCQLP